MSYQDTFLSLDINELERWVSTHRQEDLHLDFKLLTTGAELSRDDKKNLAKAISGFANSDGGLIVWGVDCRKDANNVDAASGLKPVPDADAVLSRLQSLTGEATSPIVEGVQHRIIRTSDGAGIIATLIPASDLGPHMARAGEQRYYKRSGDSFYQMEHFDIADMFGRRLRPRLSLQLKPTVIMTERNRRFTAEVIAVIENTGRGIARFPLLRLQLSDYYVMDSYGLDGKRGTGLPAQVQTYRNQEMASFAGGMNDVIHPGIELQVAKILLSSFEYIDDHQDPPPDLVVNYNLAAEGFPSQKGQVCVEGRLLIELAKKEMSKHKGLFG